MRITSIGDDQMLRSKIWLFPLLMLVLAALACDSPPITGITCLYEAPDGSIIAPEQTDSFVSRDGGLTWESAPPVEDFSSHCRYPSGVVNDVTDPKNPQIVYRFENSLSIQRSEDGGQTWRMEI